MITPVASRTLRLALFTLALSLCAGSKTMAGTAGQRASGRLIARIHDSGFPQGHDTYNGMLAASDGRIYYVLCSEAYIWPARCTRTIPRR
ncbi:MAG TPA: hypothetical protein PKK20_12475, partial [Verrucomicrobiota bacterium]|nr:hypothetical protein [Verrucomicrobiota bacterium]